MVETTPVARSPVAWWALHPVLGGGILFGAHLVVALSLTIALFRTAADFGGLMLSPDEFGRLGGGPGYGFLGIWLPLLAHPLAALASVAVSRRLGWLGPALCLLASVVLAAYFSTTFEAPAFVGG